MAVLDILIPYYNGKIELLDRLLSSIADQKGISYTDFSVKIINDGSSQEELTNSNLFNKYKFKIDYKINEHGGISKTRNALLDYCNTDYFIFCDQDDYFCNDYALYHFINIIKLHTPDIIASQTEQEWFDENNTAHYNLLSVNTQELNGTLLHGRVFKKNFIINNNIRFLPCFDGVEDYYFVGLALQLAENIRYISTPTYVWTANPSSVTHEEQDWNLISFKNVITSNTFIVRELLNRNLLQAAYFNIEQLLFEAYKKFILFDSFKENNNIVYNIKLTLYNYYKEFKNYLNKLDSGYLAQLYAQNTNISIDDVYNWYEMLIKEISKDSHIAFENSFSVIIPTHNRVELLCKAIDSVLAQDYNNYEIIVVEDNCTDNTRKVVKQKYKTWLNNKKIRYYVNTTSEHGCAAARNFGLKKAKNKWIANLDDDNIWLSNYLRTFNYGINTNKEASCFYAKWVNKIHKEYFFNLDTYFDFEKLNISNYIDNGVFVYNKKIPRNIKLSLWEDWEFILRYTSKNMPVYLDDFVLVYTDELIPRITNDTTVTNPISYSDLLLQIPNYAMTTAPSIASLIITYNHEKYIAQALESAIIQRGNFKHKIYISDDCSTDNTKKIIKEYIKAYPDLIIDISPKKHLGLSENYKQAFSKIGADYIAILEGDDYWRTWDRLSVFIKDFSKDDIIKFVFSQAGLVNEEIKPIFDCSYNGTTCTQIRKNLLDINDLYNYKEHNFIINWSASVFKAEVLKTLPDILFNNDKFSEIPVQFYVLQNGGKCYFESKPYSAYRVHSEGVWSGLDEDHKHLMYYTTRKSAFDIASPVGKLVLYPVLYEILLNLIKKDMLTSTELVNISNKLAVITKEDIAEYKKLNIN